ncbi:MAG: hypothetical protein ABSE95_05230 [Thermodesulfobacteriota bacterium]
MRNQIWHIFTFWMLNTSKGLAWPHTMHKMLTGKPPFLIAELTE